MTAGASGDLPLPPQERFDEEFQLLRGSDGQLLRVECSRDADLSLLSMAASEARVWGWVRHPNVLRYLGHREAHDRVFFYHEHARGHELGALLARARRQGASVPPGVASAIVAEVLLGLHAIHDARSPGGDALGMIHRHVGTQDILIDERGAARLRCPVPPPWDARGGCRGPAALAPRVFRFLSPEQVRGKPLDARSDVYACAGVLWEMLAGQLFIDAPSSMETLTRIIEGNIEPASALRPGLSSALDAVVARGLALDPARRFPHAAAMLQALTEAEPPSSPGEVCAWVRSLDDDAPGDASAPAWPPLLPPSSLSLPRDEGGARDEDTTHYRELPGKPPPPAHAPLAEEARPRWWLAGVVAAAVLLWAASRWFPG